MDCSGHLDGRGRAESWSCVNTKCGVFEGRYTSFVFLFAVGAVAEYAVGVG
jgi:hypothetical protein